ncbi:MFS transporter [Corynebacterium sp.]|uniref:MFS transporter n=1 Tax=Corynebacterium sp. TaxID=1720 RepID=UPI0026DBC5A8|nr:MFS transporter [Corynebacterium sp.]MDO5032375.1 MFS transporter [Corynebacterium sp.]
MDFRLYLWSDLLAQVAGVGAGLATPVVTMRLSESLTLAGVYGTITGIAALAGGVFGGALADMRRRKPLIIWTNALAGFLNLAMAALILTGEFRPWVFGTLLGSMMFFYRVGQACADPCLPQVVREEELAAKQGIIQARLQFAGLVGPAVGGLLLEINLALPFAFVGLANFLTIIFFLFIRTNLDPAKKAESKLLRTTRDGLTIVARSSLLRGLIAMQTLSNCAINGSLFMAILILEAGNNPGWVTGLARTAIGLIGILGALSTSWLQKKFSFAALQVGTCVWIAVSIACGALLSPGLWMIIPLGLSVLTAPAAGAVTYAVLHKLMAEETFGRVTNIQVSTVVSLSSAWNTPLASLSQRWTLTAGMWANVVAGLLALPSAFIFVRHVKRALSETDTTSA